LPKRNLIYWYCQVFGWSFYLIINSIFFGLSYRSTYKDYLLFFLSLPLGIVITHLYRLLIVKLRILEFKVPAQLGVIVFFSFVKGVIFFLMINLISAVFGLIRKEDLTGIFISSSILNFTVIFCLWNTFYFGFHYFQNYRRTEINSLRYLAASKESELKSLKAQLNPHFIFNCMNSIRALIDENPANAKMAVTQLSNILRNTLLMDKSKEIFLRDEINLVHDYLNLEKIRYEERLSFEFSISDEVINCQIPPFIIQSQVENAIKHGISVAPGKGKILVEALKDGELLKIKVSNTGKLNSATPLTGVGFKNSIQRLDLLYGARGKIFITEANDLVIVEISIPLKIDINTKQ
jgi:two-component system, LytTR family, sensor kinase